MQLRRLPRLLDLEPGPQELRQQAVVAEPAVPQGHDQRTVPFQRAQVCLCVHPRKLFRQIEHQPVGDARAQQEPLEAGRHPGKQFLPQIVGDGLVASRELAYERVGIGRLAKRHGGKAERHRPSLGPLGQQLDRPGVQLDPQSRQQVARLVDGEREVGSPKLRHLPPRSQARERHPGVTPRRENQPERVGRQPDQALDDAVHLAASGLLCVVDDQHERTRQGGDGVDELLEEPLVARRCAAARAWPTGRRGSRRSRGSTPGRGSRSAEPPGPAPPWSPTPRTSPRDDRPSKTRGAWSSRCRPAPRRASSGPRRRRPGAPGGGRARRAASVRGAATAWCG